MTDKVERLLLRPREAAEMIGVSRSRFTKCWPMDRFDPCGSQVAVRFACP